jgi:hypothetical protein
MVAAVSMYANGLELKQRYDERQAKAIECAGLCVRPKLGARMSKHLDALAAKNAAFRATDRDRNQHTSKRVSWIPVRVSRLK